MAKIKRRSRDKVRKKVDILKPIDFKLEDIGGDKDPCFSKHYDPKASECSRCGDSEICAIAMSQLNHIKRNIVEKSQRFKDMEEKDIPKKDPKEVRMELKKSIRTLVKDAGETGIEKDQLIDEIYARYNYQGFNKIRIGKILDIVISKSNNIIKSKTKIKWQ